MVPAVSGFELLAETCGFTADGAAFLIIDEDSIDNGLPPNFFAAADVNDDIAEIGVRAQLRYFAAHPGAVIDLHTGEVGDEGWFAVPTIPASWTAAGPTGDGVRNFLAAGPGLGSADGDGQRESLLDKIPDVTPLRATGLEMLEGRTVCAVVYDSDVSINYGPLNGSLKGSNLGTVAFDVLSVKRLIGFSSSSLPVVTIRIRDAADVCDGPLNLFTEAPKPSSSSTPADVIPVDDLDPDLIISALTAPASATAGTAISIGETTANVGSDPAGSSTTRFFLSTDSSLEGSDLLLGSRVIGTLGSGDSSSGATSVTIPASVAPGTYVLIAKADAGNIIDELNELNNLKCTGIDITRVRRPDLVPTVEFPCAAPGASITITVTTKNKGTLTAAPSTTRLYFSGDNKFDAGDTLVATFAIPELPPGGFHVSTAVVTVPADAGAKYFYIAVADTAGVVAEANERNNVDEKGCQFGPDLTGNLKLPCVAAGSTFTITDTTRNVGTVSVGATTTAFYFSLDKKLDIGTDVLLGSRAIPPLDPGEKSTGETTATLPIDAPATFFIIAFVDAEGLVAEVNESNNVKVRACKPPRDREICGDGIDNDGDGLIDEDCPTEICGDGIDNDGDGLIDEGCAATAFLVIDEDSIDNGNPPNFFDAHEVNDDIAEIGVRAQLRYFADNVGEVIELHTGQVGDEGWFAVKTIPASWVAAGPTGDGLRNFLQAGPGLGSADGSGNRESLLDKIPNVTPLRATGLKLLEGSRVCAVVYDSDVSINYGPLNGSLKGANLGIVAFEVLTVKQLFGFSDSSLPVVTLKILDAGVICAGALEPFLVAPAPVSSSLPFDIRP